MSIQPLFLTVNKSLEVLLNSVRLSAWQQSYTLHCRLSHRCTLVNAKCLIESEPQISFAATNYFWRHFLGIYPPIISWQETRIISKNINTFFSMSKTNTLITKKKNMDCLLKSGKLYWSNPNCSYILKHRTKGQKIWNVTLHLPWLAVVHKPVCPTWMTAVAMGNNLDWFLDMFWLALHTLLSSCTVSQVLKYYTLPLTRQP